MKVFSFVVAFAHAHSRAEDCAEAFASSDAPCAG